MESNFDVKKILKLLKINFFENIKNEEMENEKNNQILYMMIVIIIDKVYKSESEINEGDDEDNSEYDAEFRENDKESEESGDENSDKINIMNFNNSYSQYG